MKGKKLLRTGVPAVLVCAVLAASFSLYRTLADKGPEDILTSSLPEGEKAPQSTGTNTGSTSQANSITTAADSPLILDVPYVSQEGLLPTGCETVSAVMLVQHYGMDINVHEFIDRCLKCSDFWYEDGMLTNVSPTEAFIGDPYQADGLGCYAPVMVDALNAFFEEKAYAFRAVNTTGTSLEELCSRYLVQEDPVMVWASRQMNPFRDGMTWKLSGREETFSWLSNEHCLVLVGYDDESYYFNDPDRSAGLVNYEKALVNERFQQLGMQSVVLQSA